MLNERDQDVLKNRKGFIDCISQFSKGFACGTERTAGGIRVTFDFALTDDHASRALDAYAEQKLKEQKISDGLTQYFAGLGSDCSGDCDKSKCGGKSDEPAAE